MRVSIVLLKENKLMFWGVLLGRVLVSLGRVGLYFFFPKSCQSCLEDEPLTVQLWLLFTNCF